MEPGRQKSKQNAFNVGEFYLGPPSPPKKILATRELSFRYMLSVSDSESGIRLIFPLLHIKLFFLFSICDICVNIIIEIHCFVHERFHVRGTWMRSDLGK